MISYIEDKNILAKAFKAKNYESINIIITDMVKKNDLDYYENGLGYKIKKIDQLSEIYDADFFSINFYLMNVNPFFDEEMINYFNKMIKNLKKLLEEKEGYFIIKVPSHIPNLINSLRIIFEENSIFTGGTVCYFIDHEVSNLKVEDKIKIKMLKFEEYEKYNETIKDLSYESFKNYFGQYHISDFTRPKAPIIYKNWIRDFFKNSNNNDRMIVAEKNNKIVGFLTLYKNKNAYEIVLNAIDGNYRSDKIYERIVRFAVNYSMRNNKICTVSTQLSNIFAQRAWVNVGFKPYYSYYLFHYNNLG